MGLDMPAFRSIIRDVKRFTTGKGWGMKHIPVLEYEQMAGRAGRPGMEDFGEAILVASSAVEAEELKERYLHGKPEEIFSKLAVEPVLRTYLLSLVATGFIKDRMSMYKFFDKTFYATQYADMHTLHQLLDKMLVFLEEWEFVRVVGAEKSGVVKDEFANAEDLLKDPEPTDERFKATPVGTRVAELYLDPYTAHFLIKHLQKATAKEERLSDPALLHLLSNTLEIRPLLRPRTKDYDSIDEWLIEFDDYLLVPEPTQYSYEYDEWLASVKTTMFFLDWINEAGEETILENFGVRPGELKAKNDIADWLLYSCEELCKLLSFQQFLTPLAKMRVRLQYGVKEELLKLMRFKKIGKKRARTLYRNGIKLVNDVKKTDYSKLAQLIGPGIAKSLKEQVGETVDPKKIVVAPRKRKGQKNLADW
jgi:helicase